VRFYGTTPGGGNSGNGTIFKLMSPAKGQTAWTETLLYSFKGGSDGVGPTQIGSLIADNQGALYGTTTGGGSDNGTVFELMPPAKGQTICPSQFSHETYARTYLALRPTRFAGDA
jgi:uncharacterized repeat protein (TIGR03803 family)